MGRDPGEIYRDLTREFGEPVYDRVEAPATPEQKERLTKLSPREVRSLIWQVKKSRAVLTQAPGNKAPIGGLKVISQKRMVRGASVRDGEYLQDLCRELSWSGSSAPHPE